MLITSLRVNTLQLLPTQFYFRKRLVALSLTSAPGTSRKPGWFYVQMQRIVAKLRFSFL